MKARIGTDSFGRQLVKEFFDALCNEGRWLTSALRTDQTEIMAAFQFVRNQFAHNTMDLTAHQARALVFRMAHALTTVTSVGPVDLDDGDTPRSTGSIKP
jgi:hypothetical protein